MDRLNPLDAVFVDAEDADPHVSMAIASIAVFEGPAPSQEEVLASPGRAAAAGAALPPEAPHGPAPARAAGLGG